MIIRITYPNLLHGNDFVCFVFMNYEWIWQYVVKISLFVFTSKKQTIKQSKRGSISFLVSSFFHWLLVLYFQPVFNTKLIIVVHCRLLVLNESWRCVPINYLKVHSKKYWGKKWLPVKQKKKDKMSPLGFQGGRRFRSEAKCIFYRSW